MGVLPSWMLIGSLSAKCKINALKEKNWEDLCDSYKEMSRTVGVKKPQEKPSGK